MRIGAVLWPGNEGLFFAASQGGLAPRDFRLVEMSGGFEAIRAFRNGTLDAASLTLDEVIRAMHDGSDPVVLLAQDEPHGADAVVGKRGLSTLAALRLVLPAALHPLRAGLVTSPDAYPFTGSAVYTRQERSAWIDRAGTARANAGEMLLHTDAVHADGQGRGRCYDGPHRQSGEATDERRRHHRERDGLGAEALGGP